MGGFPALAAIGAGGQGFQQGQQNAVDLRQKMMQLQQLQMALDQAKRQTAAEAAYGNYLGSGNASAPPGQSGAPGGVPQPPQTPPGAPSPFQMGPQAPPQARPPMGAPPPGPMMGQPQGMPLQRPPMAAPAISAPGVSPAAGQQGPAAPGAGGNALQQMAQMLNSGSLDPALAVQQIGQRIAQANPGIDPQTLAMATEQAVQVMHGMGLDPATKLQMQLLLGQQRGDYGLEKQAMGDASRETQTGERVAATERGQDIGAQSREAVANIGAQSREAVGAAHDATGLQKAQMQITAMDARTRFVQGEISKRAATSGANRAAVQAQTQRLHALMGELAGAKAKLSVAANANPPDEKGVADAQKAIDVIDGKLKILEGAVKQPSSMTPTTNLINGPGGQPKTVNFNQLPAGP